MALARQNRIGPRPRRRLANVHCYAVAVVLAVALALPAVAQEAAPGVLTAGDAATTGFAGVQRPTQIAPGINPAEETFIDLGGPSLRVFDLQHMGGPPVAQFVAAPKPYTATARQIGQVFAVTHDDASPPNIYVAASSAYGLPIVALGPDGQLRHVRFGAPNAEFMPGLWGNAPPHGGPGSIWKIDGATGGVSLFANVVLDGRPNSGPGLGGIAFDPASRSLYVADRETGFIHRFDLSGKELGRYEHGVTGRQALRLNPVAFDPTRQLDITSRQFDSTDPTTWNYAPPERRVFGLGIYQRRLYYAVAAGLQIWSVGLEPDGSFANDPSLVIKVTAAAGPTEISKITFDDQGRMILAERPAPSGTFDLEVLTAQGIGRVLRYTMAAPTPSASRAWLPVPDEYAVGFPLDLRNGNGGVEIGYGYDQKGDLDHASCGGFLWSTGEQLRRSPDPSLAAQLRQTGPLVVNGLQGDEAQRIRRDDEPPLVSYFIDYSDQGVDVAARGHLGDLTIARDCIPVPGGGGGVPQPGNGGGTPRGGTPPGGGGLPGGGSPPGGGIPPGTNPPGSCPPGQIRSADSGACQPGPCVRPYVQIGARCCSPNDLKPGGACAGPPSNCGLGQIAIGPGNLCCNSGQVYTDTTGAPACCLTGEVNNGQCNPSKPPQPPGCSPGSTNSNCCPDGYVAVGGSCCMSSKVTSIGVCCPNGQSPGGANNRQCEPNKVHVPPAPPSMCCPAGKTPVADGSCCDPNLLTTTGVCCPAGDPPDPNNRTYCPQQIQILHKCASGESWNGHACVATRQSCPSDSSGTPPSCKCLPETVGTPGSCAPIANKQCPADSVGREPDCNCKQGTTGTPGGCLPIVVNHCPADSIGKWPECRCKPHTTGTPGSCAPPVVNKCPSDSVGKWPECKCKRGTTGTPGKCSKPGLPPRNPHRSAASHSDQRVRN
jgi:hypothetical protein